LHHSTIQAIQGLLDFFHLLIFKLSYPLFFKNLFPPSTLKLGLKKDLRESWQLGLSSLLIGNDTALTLLVAQKTFIFLVGRLSFQILDNFQG